MATYNLFVKLLDGKTLNLRLPTPTTTGDYIAHRLCAATGIPADRQLLLAGGRNLRPDSLLAAPAGASLFPTVHLLLRLVGGKGGFGSLLRGAATKAGQKKTNNFDACRDMSGRRLRHVNAEKKLEEWQAEAEERRLEKLAEEFLKKKAKTVKKAGSGEAEKYVEKYREESAKCIEVVEASVREAVEVYRNSKRKAAAATKSEQKRLKIWMGKQKLEDSDSDETDDDDDDDDDDDNVKEEDDETSVVLDEGNNSESSKEEEGSSSVSYGKGSVEPFAGTSCESGSEEEKDFVVPGSLISQETTPPDLEDHGEGNGVVQACSEVVIALCNHSVQTEDSGSQESKPENVEGQTLVCSFSKDTHEVETRELSKTGDCDPASKLVVNEVVLASKENLEIEKPLNFDDFNAATEMEVLGMDILKSELQSRGLKCGGTLQERAARLFLLKTTSVEMLPKKLLAKK